VERDFDGPPPGVPGQHLDGQRYGGPATPVACSIEQNDQGMTFDILGNRSRGLAQNALKSAEDSGKIHESVDSANGALVGAKVLAESNVSTGPQPLRKLVYGTEGYWFESSGVYFFF